MQDLVLFEKKQMQNMQTLEVKRKHYKCIYIILKEQLIFQKWTNGFYLQTCMSNFLLSPSLYYSYQNPIYNWVLKYLISVIVTSFEMRYYISSKVPMFVIKYLIFRNKFNKISPL